ncbi:hypothetical protein GGQ68_004139 [Sagittula marina]|uniref:Uncharacterized protein n=1 Tax=Sagittula marina TaxID=943940 RepID=A0A7W6GU43_9RHOB|nr:hypothetical protein [Sagittula marina]MBB3987785.1 hypothetical protein [Sagittula marina]
MDELRLADCRDAIAAPCHKGEVEAPVLFVNYIAKTLSPVSPDSGIGHAIAFTFADACVSIMASDLDLDAAKAVAGEITDAGGQVVARACNMTKQDDPSDIFTGIRGPCILFSAQP